MRTPGHAPSKSVQINFKKPEPRQIHGEYTELDEPEKQQFLGLGLGNDEINM